MDLAWLFQFSIEDDKRKAAEEHGKSSVKAEKPKDQDTWLAILYCFEICSALICLPTTIPHHHPIPPIVAQFKPTHHHPSLLVKRNIAQCQATPRPPATPASSTSLPLAPVKAEADSTSADAWLRQWSAATRALYRRLMKITGRCLLLFKTFKTVFLTQSVVAPKVSTG